MRNEEAPLTARLGLWFYSKVNRRRRTEAIDVFDAFFELIGHYLHAAYARCELVASKK